MIRLAAVGALLLALGCEDGPAITCNLSCGTCSSGQVCFGGGHFYSAQCARSCNTTDDCSGHDHCLLVAGQPGPVCLSDATPCAGNQPTCMVMAARCVDANTLQTIFSTSACAYEHTHCANGCSNGACN
jgi:hypothetical protein